MAILLTETSRVVIQGIGHANGLLYTERMIASGTNIVAVTYPGHGGEWFSGKPAFDTLHTAVSATAANASVIFAEPIHAVDSIYEAVDAGIHLIICVAQNLPLLDVVRVREYIRNTPSRLIGPNSPGILVPGLGSVGIIPPQISSYGTIGVVSRSSVLAFEATQLLTAANYGQSAIVGIGSGPVVGTSFVDILARFESDPDTTEIVLIGGIGGHLENDAAEYIRSELTKPVIAYIAGVGFPPNAVLNYMGTIGQDVATSADYKALALENAGARVVKSLEHIVPVIQSAQN
jgi:succinyl-CoA synthetase alpha subunit